MDGTIRLDGLEEALRAVVREEVAAALARTAERDGAYLNVDSTASFLDTTPDAVRSLVRRDQLPVHRTPQGRLLFDPAELKRYVQGRAA